MKYLGKYTWDDGLYLVYREEISCNYYVIDTQNPVAPFVSKTLVEALRQATSEIYWVDLSKLDQPTRSRIIKWHHKQEDKGSESLLVFGVMGLYKSYEHVSDHDDNDYDVYYLWRPDEDDFDVTNCSVNHKTLPWFDGWGDGYFLKYDNKGNYLLFKGL